MNGDREIQWRGACLDEQFKNLSLILCTALYIWLIGVIYPNFITGSFNEFLWYDHTCINHQINDVSSYENPSCSYIVK